MSRFFVGQQVKVKWFRWGRGSADTGRISEIGAWKDGEFHPGHRLYFPDDSECIVVLSDGELGAFLFEQLEPIKPLGEAPGIKGTCEPLDKLLSEVRDREVST